MRECKWPRQAVCGHDGVEAPDCAVGGGLIAQGEERVGWELASRRNGLDALTSLRLRRLGSGVAAKSSGKPAGPLLRFELMVAASQLFDTGRNGRL